MRSGGAAVCHCVVRFRCVPTRSFFFRQLYEPYSDNPETRGFMRLSTEVLNEIIPNFLRDGWQVVSPMIFVHFLFTLTLFPFFL